MDNQSNNSSNSLNTIDALGKTIKEVSEAKPQTPINNIFAESNTIKLPSFYLTLMDQPNTITAEQIATLYKLRKRNQKLKYIDSISQKSALATTAVFLLIAVCRYLF